MGLGSGIRKKPIPDLGPGVKSAPDSGSGTLVSVYFFEIAYPVLILQILPITFFMKLVAASRQPPVTPINFVYEGKYIKTKEI
jgi:hypothetical protein